jgi:hypothetical protein
VRLGRVAANTNGRRAGFRERGVASCRQTLRVPSYMRVSRPVAAS